MFLREPQSPKNNRKNNRINRLRFIKTDKNNRRTTGWYAARHRLTAAPQLKQYTPQLTRRMMHLHLVWRLLLFIASTR